MRIYCTSHDNIHLARTGSVNIIMTRAVYSHTTLNAIQYYIITKLFNHTSPDELIQGNFIVS